MKKNTTRFYQLFFSICIMMMMSVSTYAFTDREEDPDLTAAAVDLQLIKGPSDMLSQQTGVLHPVKTPSAAIDLSLVLFSGSSDGQGYTIKNLQASPANSYATGLNGFVKICGIPYADVGDTAIRADPSTAASPPRHRSKAPTWIDSEAISFQQISSIPPKNGILHYMIM